MRASVFPAMVMALLLVSGCAAHQKESGTMQANPLFNQWQLSMVEEQALRWQPDAGIAPFTLILTAEGETAHGQVACNRWHGAVRIEGAQLSIGPSRSTRARCLIDDPAHRSLERRYLAALQQVSRYHVEAKRLVLEWENGDRWVFSAR